MRQEIINIYKFEELSEEAKENARNWFKESMNNDFSYEEDCITENMIETLTANGYDDAKPFWSLSNCQGDGVCFTWDKYGNDILPLLNRIYNNNISRNVKRVLPFIHIMFNSINHHYCHKMTVQADWEYSNFYRGLSSRVDKVVNELVKKLEHDRQEICDKLEKQGYDEIDYYYSNERVNEILINSDYEFTEKGEII